MEQRLRSGSAPSRRTRDRHGVGQQPQGSRPDAAVRWREEQRYRGRTWPLGHGMPDRSAFNLGSPVGLSDKQKGGLTVALEDTKTAPGTDVAGAPMGCPAHVSPDQFRHFDYIADVESAPTPFDGYLQFRGERPFWSDVSGGFWVLTDAATIRDCFQQPEIFSNRNIGLGYTEQSRKMIPEQLDPPEHGKYRKLLSPFFTPASARRLQDGIRAVCRAEMDKFVDRGHCDFVEEFAGRFPQIVFIQYIMNFPVEEMETFLGWENDIMRHPVEESKAKASAQELWSYLTETIQNRTRDPLDGDML